MRSTVIFFGFCLLASRSLGQQNELKEQSQNATGLAQIIPQTTVQQQQFLPVGQQQNSNQNFLIPVAAVPVADNTQDQFARAIVSSGLLSDMMNPKLMAQDAASKLIPPLITDTLKERSMHPLRPQNNGMYPQQAPVIAGRAMDFPVNNMLPQQIPYHSNNGQPFQQGVPFGMLYNGQGMAYPLGQQMPIQNQQVPQMQQQTILGQQNPAVNYGGQGSNPQGQQVPSAFPG